MATLLVSCLVRAFLLLVLNAAALGSDVCLDGEMVAAQGDQLLQKESSLRFASAPAQPVAGDQDHRTDDKEHATLPFSLLAASSVPNYSEVDSTAKTVGAEAALPVSLLASSLDSAPSSKKSSGVKAAPGKKSAEKSVARKAATSKAKASKGAASKAAPAKKSAEKSVAHKAATSKAKAAPAKKSAEKSVAHKAAASKATASKGVASKAAPAKKSAEKSVAHKAAASKATASKGVASKGTKKTKAKQEETVDSSSENEVLETNFKKGKKFVSTGATRQHAEPAASKTKRSNAPAHARGAEKGAAHAKGVAKENTNAKAKKAKKLTLTKTSKLHGKIKAASVTGKKSKKSKAEAAEDLEDEAEEDLEDEAKDATTGTLFNPVIGSVVVLMSAPAGMLLLSFGAFLWVRSQDDVEMGA